MRSVMMRLQATAGRILRRTPLARWEWLNRLNNALAVRLGRADRARVGDFTVRFDPRDRVIAKHLLLYGVYEPHETAAFRALVRRGDTALDVGANIGLYSLVLSRAVGPEGRVIAVEPDPSNQEILRANLAANGCANVVVVPCALGREARTADLYQDSANRGQLSFADLSGEGRSLRVEVRTPREVLTELGASPRIAKIDVEGAEPDVVAGLDPLPDIVLFEFVPSQLRAQGHDPMALLRHFADRGFDLEPIDPFSGEHSPRSPEEVLASALGLGRDLNVLARRRGSA